MKYYLAVSIFAFCSVYLQAQQSINVIAWNIESGDSDASIIASRIEDMNGIDIWGLSEVEGEHIIAKLEAAAEDGEGADFESILGTTGAQDRLLIIYNADRFALEEEFELDETNIGGRVRAALVAHLRDLETGAHFFFMVNHLYRSRAERRHQQSRILNEWADQQTIPVIAVGDYNYDWEVEDGDADHDQGYDLLTAGGIFTWVRPERLVRTQCTARGNGCKFNSVLDFVFLANSPGTWQASSEIIVTPGDFPDDRSTSDHRPVQGTIKISESSNLDQDELMDAIRARIHRLEQELDALKSLVN